MAASQGSVASTSATYGGAWKPVLVPVVNHAGSFVVTPVFEATTDNRKIFSCRLLWLCNGQLFLFTYSDVLNILQIEAEIEEEAKWTGGGGRAPDDDDDEDAHAPALFKIDELVCVRDDARGGRHVT